MQLLPQLVLHLRLLAPGLGQLGLDAVAKRGDGQVRPGERLHRGRRHHAVPLLGGERPRRRAERERAAKEEREADGVPLATPDQVGAALAGLGRLFAEYLASGLTIVDAGRWRSDSPATDLVRSAATTVLVVHPTVAGVAHARDQYEDLAGRCSDVVVACRGDRPYDPVEVAEAIGCGTATVIPVDRVGASMLSGAPKERWLRRTPLARSARGLVDSLTQHSAVAS